MYLDATQLMDFDLHLRLIFRRMLMKFFCRVESKARLRHKKGQSVEVRTKTVVSHHRPTTERQGAEAGGSGRGRSRRRRRSQARCRAGFGGAKGTKCLLMSPIVVGIIPETGRRHDAMRHCTRHIDSCLVTRLNVNSTNDATLGL